MRCHPNPNQRRDDSDHFGTEHHRRGRYHLDVHVAAALDERGTLLGVESFATTERGYKKLLGWLSDFGPVELVGIEGTGSYGAGLTRHLQPSGSASWKSTAPTDSAGGSRASLIPKTPSRLLVPPSRVTPRVRPRPGTETSNPCGFCGWLGLGTQGSNPSAQPDAQPGLDRPRFHPGRAPGPERVQTPPARLVLTARDQTGHRLADQVQPPHVDPPGPHPRRGDLRDRRHPQTFRQGPPPSSSPPSASGPTPRRRSSSRPRQSRPAAQRGRLAHLCGASPLDASSGKNERHRLNRSGDRQANSALWHIVLTRMVYDPRTTEYIDRPRNEG